jgi:hypothetical protein
MRFPFFCRRSDTCELAVAFRDPSGSASCAELRAGSADAARSPGEWIAKEDFGLSPSAQGGSAASLFFSSRGNQGSLGSTSRSNDLHSAGQGGRDAALEKPWKPARGRIPSSFQVVQKLAREPG